MGTRKLSLITVCKTPHTLSNANSDVKRSSHMYIANHTNDKRQQIMCGYTLNSSPLLYSECGPGDRSLYSSSSRLGANISSETCQTVATEIDL